MWGILTWGQYRAIRDARSQGSAEGEAGKFLPDPLVMIWLRRCWLEGLSTRCVVLQFLGFSVVLCIWPVVCGHG